MNARVHIRRVVAGFPTVMDLEQFDLELTGRLQGNTLVVTGGIPGTELRLSGIMMKRGDLPTRATSA